VSLNHPKERSLNAELLGIFSLDIFFLQTYSVNFQTVPPLPSPQQPADVCDGAIDGGVSVELWPNHISPYFSTNFRPPEK